MVKGLDRFREYFAGHEDGYALIGGAACDILFGEAGLPFRATKDFDIVLCVEVVSVEFGTVLAGKPPRSAPRRQNGPVLHSHQSAVETVFRVAGRPGGTGQR